MNKKRVKELLSIIDEKVREMIGRGETESERSLYYSMISAYLELAYQEIDKE